MKLLLKLKQVPNFARANRKISWPIYAGAPRQWRFDGRSGEFRVGSTIAGKLLEAIVLDFRWIREDRFGRETQYWLDLAFVDKDGRVSILPLKKDSSVNAFEFLSDCFEKDLFPYAFRIYLEPQPMAAEDGGIFYVLQVKGCKPIEQSEFDAILDFQKSDRFQWILAGEVDEP